MGSDRRSRRAGKRTVEEVRDEDAQPLVCILVREDADVGQLVTENIRDEDDCLVLAAVLG